MLLQIITGGGGGGGVYVELDLFASHTVFSNPQWGHDFAKKKC